MKRKISKVLCFIMAMSMMLMFAACGNDNENAVVEYAKMNETAIVQIFNDSGAGQYASISVKNEGTNIVVESQFAEEPPEGAEESLEAGLDSISELLKETLAKMKEEEPEISTLIIRYLDHNGEVVAERKFS